MENNTNSNMLTMANMLAREKGIDTDEVLEALESAIQKAATSRYGLEFDIRVRIHRDTGVTKLARYTEIVETDAEIENEMTQISLKDAKVSHPHLNVGDFIVEELPPLEFGRIAAQAAKQVIVQKVREAERNRQFEDFKNRVGEIISGTVKRVEYNSLVLDIGMAEAFMRRDELIGKEQYRRGDRVRAYIYDVSRQQRGPQIFLSRTHPQFLVQLFRQEVPEIEEGIIEVVNVSRDPGSRAKICVKANESGLDPVGSCVGMRGSRVQAVVGELLGEKIDIIEHVDNMSEMVKKALQPAEVSRVIVDNDAGKVEAVVAQDQLSLAIGRRGQNVRLASQLFKIDLDIITVEQEQQRREEKYVARSQIFKALLGIDDVIARLLVAEGFTSVEDLAMISVEELSSIEGMTKELAKDLQGRAKNHILEEESNMQKAIEDMGIQQDLIDFLGIGTALVKLGEKDIKTLTDLADLASDELQEILEEMGITEEEAANIILQARETDGWFDDGKEQDTEQQ